MRKKGISLPIEMVIIIAISVIVLLALVAFFVMQMNNQSGRMNNAQAWQDACAIIKQRGGCVGNEIPPGDFESTTIYNWRPYNDEADGTLLDACRIGAGTDNTESCIDACCKENVEKPSRPSGEPEAS